MRGSKAINPFTDFGFKKLFGEEGSKDVLIDFLNAVLKRPYGIKEITFQNNEKYGDVYRERKVIYDIYCTDESGAQFIVEMQNAKQTYFKDRTIFYSTFPIREQAEKGDWNFKLKPVYCIGLLGFDIEKGDDKYIYEAKLKDQYNEVFYDKLTFIYIELPKFNIKEDKLESNVEKWLYFLKHLEDFNELPSILNQPIFQKAFERAKEVNLTTEEKDNYEESLKVYRDNINVIDTARAEGLQEGIEQGIERGIEKGKQEEKIEIAKNLILAGINNDTISISTGLFIDDIENLRRK